MLGGSGGNEGDGAYPDASFTTQIINPTLYIIDPYLSPFNGSTQISESAVISSLSNYPAVRANGMITDGTATAIAVYSVGANLPVTFAGTDGVQFESWNPQFLSYQPSTGNCGGQCTITVNPIQGSDGSYYAFAFLLAPKQSSSVTYTPQAASITASITINNQADNSQPVQLGIEPTPVILVHGLWSKAVGMNVQLYDLDNAQPWEAGNYLYTAVTETCYASSIPFDAVNDLGAGCNQSSADALMHSISDVQSSLYIAHYVGGRVDIVAHSMGGWRLATTRRLLITRRPRTKREAAPLGRYERLLLLTPLRLAHRWRAHCSHRRFLVERAPSSAMAPREHIPATRVLWRARQL